MKSIKVNKEQGIQGWCMRALEFILKKIRKMANGHFQGI